MFRFEGIQNMEQLNHCPVFLINSGDKVIIRHDDTGEVEEFETFTETFERYTDILSDFFAASGIHIELPEEDAVGVPDKERDGRTEIELQTKKRFDEIKKAAHKNYQIKLFGSAEEDVYPKLVELCRNWETGFYPEEVCKAESNRLFVKFLERKKEEILLHDIFLKNQQFIKESDKTLRFINQNADSAPLEELLLSAIKFICLNRGETVTYEVLKKRLEKRQTEEKAVAEASREEVERVIEAWNAVPGVPKVTKIPKGSIREKHLKARIAENGIETVIEVIGKISSSEFLTGKNDRKWKITFDWFVLPKNFLNVAEESYGTAEDKPKVSYDLDAYTKKAFQNPMDSIKKEA